MRATIRELHNLEINNDSSKINCTVMSADFNTNRPNPRRIEMAARDIGEYLNYKRQRLDKE